MPGWSSSGTATGCRRAPRAARSSCPRCIGRERSELVPDRLGRQPRPSRSRAGAASSVMIQMSSFALPGGSSALRTRWTRRSRFVTVPSDSMAETEAGKHHVGHLGRLRHEDVLDDEAVECLEQMLRARARRPRTSAGFSPITYSARELAALHRLEHLRQVPAVLRRDRHAPGGLEPRSGVGVLLDVLEAGQLVRDARPCRRRPARCSGRGAGSGRCRSGRRDRSEQRQVDQREHVVDGVVVLGDAQGPAEIARSAFA